MHLYNINNSIVKIVLFNGIFTMIRQLTITINFDNFKQNYTKSEHDANNFAELFISIYIYVDKIIHLIDVIVAKHVETVI